MQMSDLPALSIRRPTLVVVMNMLIVIAGAAALFGLEVRELPDVDRPVVTVRAFFDGASPETMDAEVTSVIEGAVARVSGVKAINAASEENNARIRPEFSVDTDLDVAANDVREAVGSYLPVRFYGRIGGKIPMPNEIGREIRSLQKEIMTKEMEGNNGHIS